MCVRFDRAAECFPILTHLQSVFLPVSFSFSIFVRKKFSFIKINATKFVSFVFACIIVSFLFHALVTTGSKCILPGRDVFFILCFSLFLAKSLLLCRAPCPSFACRPSFSSSVGHVSNHPTKEEKTSGNSYSPTYNSKSGFTLLEVSSFSSSLVRHNEPVFFLFVFDIFPTSFNRCNFDIRSNLLSFLRSMNRKVSRYITRM